MKSNREQTRAPRNQKYGSQNTNDLNRRVGTYSLGNYPKQIKKDEGRKQKKF